MRWRTARAVAGLLAMLLTAVSAGRAEEPADLAAYDALIKPLDRGHWSYRPVVRSAIPQVRRQDWVRTPIDAFILAKLEEQNWQPAAAAEPRDLLRRVFLDVIGLPPTPAEQETLLTDTSPAAWDRLVNDLLQRPGYGERWARHWLDLVRYAETNGYERDAIKPHVWRYRDYVIDSLNQDKPYDRFVLEQLAGDELPDANAETLVATGYYRLGPWDDEPADVAQDRYDQLDDQIRTTSEVFLGMTLGCARCHNHKFDAVTVHDYYRMTAIFAGLQRSRGGRTELDLPAGTRDELQTLATRDKQIAEKNAAAAALRDAFRKSFVQGTTSQLPAEALEAFRTEAAQRTPAQQQLVKQHSPALEKELDAALPAELRQQVAAIQEQIAALKVQVPDLPRGYFPHEPVPNAPVSFLLYRGRASQTGPEVQPGLPTVLVPQQPEFLPPDAFTSRRRLTLARWIARPENPLTARVLVNRVWQHHFGQALVGTPNDFGVLGEPPSHPELLDWLADWFVHDAGWSLKKLHHLILTSNTYQMSKRWNDEYGAQDPRNDRFWRFPYTRLEVEPIRDSMLAASGQLNPTMHGPSVYLHVPREILEGHSDPNAIWQPFNEAEASRRTIYAFIKRSLIVPMLDVLDLCDSTRSSEKRNITSVATQALTLFNGDFVNRQSEHLARRLEREAGAEPAAQIERAYLLALCRPPTAAETGRLQEFLVSEAVRLQEVAPADQPLSEQDARHRALVQVCRVILNLNEFVYPN